MKTRRPGKDDVLMPEASDYASAVSESHERADMSDGADSGEGWNVNIGRHARSDRAGGETLLFHLYQSPLCLTNPNEPESRRGFRCLPANFLMTNH